MKCPTCEGSGKEWIEVIGSDTDYHALITCKNCDGSGVVPE